MVLTFIFLYTFAYYMNNVFIDVSPTKYHEIKSVIIDVVYKQVNLEENILTYTKLFL